MSRPTKEQVDEALERFAIAYSADVRAYAFTLAAEVRALRNENAKLSGLVDFQQAAIARVEALCGACQGGPHHMIGQRFSRALKGSD